MGLPLSEVRDVSCPLCGASPGLDCVRIDAEDGGGKKRARVHQRRVQAAGRMRLPAELTECRPARAVLAEATEALFEGHPEKPSKLARAAAFLSRPTAAGPETSSLACGQTAAALVHRTPPAASV